MEFRNINTFLKVAAKQKFSRAGEQAGPEQQSSWGILSRPLPFR